MSVLKPENDKNKELESNNLINLFKKLKSDYFLQKLFGNIKRNKFLKIIKLNKIAKKRLNIDIKDYKEYSEIYSPIELEITPTKGICENFINFGEKDESYFHIYFNNDKVEIKRNYIKEKDKIDNIKIIIDYQVKSFSHLFNECGSISIINFNKFYRNNINNMSHMFSKCLTLKEINFNNFNTDNVTNMLAMFSECALLEKITNLSKFNTSNVTNMCSLFSSCWNLKESDLSNFNTEKVTDMSYMFYHCSGLEKLNLSNFNTNKVTTMGYMFSGCQSLQNINLSNFDTSNVTNMDSMFYECVSLKNIDLSNFNTNNVTIMIAMFGECDDELVEMIQDKYKDIKEEAFWDE